jgi:hypothetical protein
MTGHTPGPWRVDDGHVWHQDEATGAGYRFRVIVHEGGAVAWVADDEGDPECPANAALVAAAPRLLAVAIDALDLLGDHEAIRDELRAAVDEARLPMASSEMTPNEIFEDVKRNHVAHQRECPECTWWYCEHYECDCRRDHAAAGDLHEHEADLTATCGPCLRRGAREAIQGPGKFEGEGPMTPLLYSLSLNGWADEIETFGDGASIERLGRWTLVSDSQGFVYGQRHDDEAAAQKLITEAGERIEAAEEAEAAEEVAP